MTVYGTIFLSAKAQNFCESLGDQYKAAEVVRSHLIASLDHHFNYHDIQFSDDFSFDPDDYGCSTLDCAWRNFWNNWLPGHPDESEDFNLMLLLDSEASGKNGGSTGSATSHPAAVVRGADHIAYHDYSEDRYGSAGSTTEGRIRASVHEIGHNLGVQHKDGYRYFDGSSAKATPMGCSAGSTNSCGDNCTSLSTNDWDHYYGNCEVNKGDELN